jgi:hypothetical protein
MHPKLRLIALVLLDLVHKLLKQNTIYDKHGSAGQRNAVQAKVAQLIARKIADQASVE